MRRGRAFVVWFALAWRQAHAFAWSAPLERSGRARDAPPLTSVEENTNTWAVIIDASRFWFNYRHSANALSMYRTVKRLGIPDSRVVLMLADDAACDARNPQHGRMYNDVNRGVELYGDDIEVDYRGTEVTPETVIRVLTNKHARGTPRSKKLLTDGASNILVYITGHGGDGFIKFQDQLELRTQELADAFAQMYAKNRYNEVFFIAETCQASTLAKAFASPRILALSSSGLGENSFSHHSDPDIGVYVIDRFTYNTLEFFEQLNVENTTTADAYVKTLTQAKLLSTAVLDTKTFKHRAVNTVKLTEFFGGVSKTKVLSGVLDWFVGAESTSERTKPPTLSPKTPSLKYESVDIKTLGFR
jgi:GPI-anchor transamidase subunit K